MKIEHPLNTYLPDTRGVVVSRFGKGNLKIGPNVFTYSRMPGRPRRAALGMEDLFERGESAPEQCQGTCPGATEECIAICYARRVVKEGRFEQRSVVTLLWEPNTYAFLEIPEIPAECKLLRLHISGDFSSVNYIEQWTGRLIGRPDVTCWAYTKSWRVPALLPALEVLRALPNVQLFASMDPSDSDLPPRGWRRAWIHRTEEKNGWPVESRLIGWKASWFGGQTPNNLVAVTDDDRLENKIRFTFDNWGRRCVADTRTPAFVCPEETGRKKNCEECRYCFDGKRNDVVFLEH